MKFPLAQVASVVAVATFATASQAIDETNIGVVPNVIRYLRSRVLLKPEGPPGPPGPPGGPSGPTPPPPPPPPPPAPPAPAPAPGRVCIASDTQLYSCTAEQVVSAHELSVGDEVQAIDTKSGDKVCSPVYYVFPHEGMNRAVRITTVDQESLTVSFDHLVYVGETFEGRVPTLSQNVEAGDKLVTSSNKDAVVVEAVEVVDAELVNILPVEPHLVLQTTGSDNIVISAHAFDHDLYGQLFLPIKKVYLNFGASAVNLMQPLFKALEEYDMSVYWLQMVGLTASKAEE